MEKQESQKNEMSYIESLPDCLLVQIVSFLSTRAAVKTSLISRRWKELWKFVPCLYLCNWKLDRDEAFINFVNCVLRFRKTEQLDTLNLMWQSKDQKTCITNTWLQDISNLKPKKLIVDVGRVFKVSWFPSYLLSCTTIEHLHLRLNISKIVEINPKMVNLPILKSLTLTNVVIHEGVISAFPLLEKLYLHDCSFRMREIASLKLKKLAISGVYTTTLRISAPYLEWLYCSAPFGQVSLENMPHLELGRIVFPDAGSGNTYDGKDVKVLPSLANARKLCFEGNDFEKMWKMESQNCSPFRNVKRVHFRELSVCKDMQPIASFLRFTPNIEELSLFDMKVCTHEGEKETAQKIQCCSLESIEISGPHKHHRQVHEVAEVVQKNFNTAEVPLVTITLYNKGGLSLQIF